MGRSVGNDTFEPKILGVLREVAAAGTVVFRKVCKLALHLYKSLLLDLFFEGKFQLPRKGVGFRMEVVRGAVL
jgi:hypothetical protein